MAEVRERSSTRAATVTRAWVRRKRVFADAAAAKASGMRERERRYLGVQVGEPGVRHEACRAQCGDEEGAKGSADGGEPGGFGDREPGRLIGDMADGVDE